MWFDPFFIFVDRQIKENILCGLIQLALHPWERGRN